MSRAVRLALWDYRPAGALTSSCDKDVDSQCPKVCGCCGCFFRGVEALFGIWSGGGWSIYVEPVQHLIMHSSCVPAAAWV